jgi:hypothetical protein
MISENIEMFLSWFKSILKSGVIGYGFYFSVGTMLETEIRKKIVPVIMNMERRYKKNGR